MKKIICLLVFMFLFSFTVFADTSPSYYILGAPTPAYPKELMGTNSEGIVKIKVNIDTNGFIKKTEIAQSSGIEDFDITAKLTIERGWKFKQTGNDYSLIIEVTFLIGEQGNPNVSVNIDDPVIKKTKEVKIVVSTNSDNPVKAFRDINFGDSQDTIKRKIEDDIKILEMYYGSEIYKHRIGGIFYHVYFDYYKDQLCSIEFISNDEMANYFDTKIKKAKRYSGRCNYKRVYIRNIRNIKR